MGEHESRSDLLYRCWCKGTRREGTQHRHSFNWLLARRAYFRVFSDKIQCGNWEIPFSQVGQAVVYNTRQLFIPGKILHLVTSDGDYQFGFNPWAKPIDHLKLDISEQNVRLKYSSFSIVLRGMVLAWIVYEAWQHFLQN